MALLFRLVNYYNLPRFWPSGYDLAIFFGPFLANHGRTDGLIMAKKMAMIFMEFLPSGYDVYIAMVKGMALIEIDDFPSYI